VQKSYSTDEIISPQLNVEYYGADFPVDVLVKRMKDGDFIIPNFQREYVWNAKEASRFIESLLIGLPTPALFLAKDKFSSQYLVIDGQQRLKTLQYFYQESFPDGKHFSLVSVIEPFERATYSTLSLTDRRLLDNAIIHCIIITENYEPLGMYYLFERLNTTGNPLTPQEIRNVIYHGLFSRLIQELAQNEIWNKFFSKESNKSKRAKDQEMILRFLALHFHLEHYQGNMTDFLNNFMLKNKNLDLVARDTIENLFFKTITLIQDCLGLEVFYYKNNQINISLYDAVMLLVAKEIFNDLDCQKLVCFYQSLVKDDHFWSLSKHSTTSKKNMLAKIHRVEELYRISIL